MKYPAGKTVLVPVPLDVLLPIMMKEFSSVLYERTDDISVGPPRRRPEYGTTDVILKFIKENPGRYCTREIIDQHSHLNFHTVRSAVYTLSKRRLIVSDQAGKWTTTAAAT